MHRKFLPRITHLPAAALLVTGTLLAAPHPSDASAIKTEASARISQTEAWELLEQTRHLAAKLHRDAGTLEALASSNQVGWQTHAHYLSRAREHINSMGELLARLREIHPAALPWQRQAIERCYPAAVELASRTEAAILHLHDNRNRLRDPQYRNHLGAIAERAGEMKGSVTDFLELGETHEELARLQEKLEATAG